MKFDSAEKSLRLFHLFAVLFAYTLMSLSVHPIFSPLLWDWLTFFLNIYAGEFDDILDRSNSKSLSDSLEDIDIIYKDFISSSSLESNGSTPQEKHETLLEIENLILKTPSDSTLITDLSLAIKAKDNLLVRHQLSPNCRIL
jgi:hypothetical protein